MLAAWASEGNVRWTARIEASCHTLPSTEDELYEHTKYHANLRILSNLVHPIRSVRALQGTRFQELLPLFVQLVHVIPPEHVDEHLEAAP